MFIGKLSLLEDKIDSFLYMQLVDLARMLTRRKELEVEAAYHALYDEAAGILTVSQFWHDLLPSQRDAGMKSDVILRALGSAWFSSSKAIADYFTSALAIPLPNLAQGLFALCEDIRLERLCLALRPGTQRLFNQRHTVYNHYLQHKLQAHLNKTEQADACFILIYRWLTGRSQGQLDNLSTGAVSGLNELLNWLLPLYPLLEQMDTAETTEEVAHLSLLMMEHLAYRLRQDAKMIYFSTQQQNGRAEPVTMTYYQELKRVKPLQNKDKPAALSEEWQQADKERLPMRHRETQDRSPGLLRFELERGSRTAAAADALREGDAAEEVLAFVQGRSQRSERKNAVPGEQRVPRIASGSELAAGEAGSGVNATATASFLPLLRPTAQQEDAYQRLAERAAPLTKRLRRTIRQTLAQKRIAPRGDLLYGRLSKKLIRAVTDEAPRLFYKKRSPDPQLDAAFTLLVDCSASMYDKMDETKLGLTLFHETLKGLRIPHEIVGFWEDADRVTEEEAPNLFQVAVDFSSSCTPRSGATLLQLEPQQDNRDGFAIRQMTQRLLRRAERHRVLLVFSDGEPSAADYNEAGILDTYEAVLQARRMGIDVISVFLASGAVHDTQRQTMRNLYGPYSIVVPRVEELTQQLAPLLRKLLLKAIF